ncbi:MAG: two-component regulator propeller domain-containing protein [Candidatus Ozemobacteraceae bacterium]
MTRRICLFAVFLITFLFLRVPVEGVGSLHPVGGVFKKTSYQCVFRSMVEDSSGRLWAGTFGAGLFSFDGKKWTHIASSPNALPDDRLSKLLIAKSDDSKLFIATAGGGACQFDLVKETWSPLGNSPELSSRHFHAFLHLSDGRFLLGSVGDGLFVGRGQSWKHYGEPDGLPSAWINDAATASDGVLIATSEGLALLKNDRITDVELPCGSWTDGAVNVIALFHDEWFLGTASGGLIGRTIDPKAPAAGLPLWKTRRYRRIPGISGSVHALLPDCDTLWVAAETGLFSFDGTSEPVKMDGPWKPEEAFKCLLKRQNGQFIAGTADGRLYAKSANTPWTTLFDYSNFSQEVVK